MQQSHFLSQLYPEQVSNAVGNIAVDGLGHVLIALRHGGVSPPHDTHSLAVIEDDSSALLFIARPRHVGFTLNSDAPYSGGILDLRESGPMVIELPPGPLVGLVEVDDHHHRWVTDLGLPGADAGKGGKHLIVPPDWEGQVPDGYSAARCRTWTAFCELRVLPLGGDQETANKLLSSMRFYPLSASQDPPEYIFTAPWPWPAPRTAS